MFYQALLLMCIIGCSYGQFWDNDDDDDRFGMWGRSNSFFSNSWDRSDDRSDDFFDRSDNFFGRSNDFFSDSRETDDSDSFWGFSSPRRQFTRRSTSSFGFPSRRVTQRRNTFTPSRSSFGRTTRTFSRPSTTNFRRTSSRSTSRPSTTFNSFGTQRSQRTQRTQRTPQFQRSRSSRTRSSNSRNRFNSFGSRRSTFQRRQTPNFGGFLSGMMLGGGFDFSDMFEF